MTPSSTSEGGAYPQSNAPAPAPAGEVSEVVEHLFRHESARMVAILTRIFGIEHLSLAEDVVQEALVRALQTWPFHGVPRNPSAWILRASRNLALDVVRRQKRFREKEAEIVSLLDGPSSSPDAGLLTEHEIEDDRLRMMFVCCHPVIPAEAQVALALNTLCGFNVAEISRAFLASEAAIAKRLTRAKQQIREARIPFEIPTGKDLAGRLDRVLRTLYLLFNEGYKASSGEKLVRDDVCHEAIRLAELLVNHAAGNQSRAHALLAMMLLNAARFPARVDDDGNLLRLGEQNRSLWNQPMIARGMYHLARSAEGDDMTEYHIQAGIAACHCAAKNFESTDWQQILELYDGLIRFDRSPVVELNRAIVVANVQGPEAGLKAVAAIRDLQKLSSYYLLHATLGELELRREQLDAAARHLQRALELAGLDSERAFLSKRLRQCQPVASGL